MDDIISSDTQAYIARILRYWQALEYIKPFDLDETEKAYSLSLELDLECLDEDLPWLSPEVRAELGCLPDKDYAYHLYLGAFEKNELNRLAAELSGNPHIEAWNDARSLDGLTCFARFSLNRYGSPSPRHYMLSTLPLGLKHLKGESLAKITAGEFRNYFEQVADDIYCLAESNITEEQSSFILTATSLKALLSSILSRAGWEPERFSFLARVCLYEVARLEEGNDAQECLDEKRIEEEELLIEEEAEEGLEAPVGQSIRLSDYRRPRVDILNSFFLRDLEMARAQVEEKPHVPSTIKHYLSGDKQSAERIDLFEEQNLETIMKSLRPEANPLGKWPSPTELKMTLMQQFALNAALAKEAETSVPVFAVNGPPGTGKTTLLRETIAAIITERATKLAKLKTPLDAKTNWLPILDFEKPCYVPALSSELTGYEILVTSSNNNAVENVSRELPRMLELGEEYRESASYLRQTANSVLREDLKSAEPSRVPWGLVCAVLGNKKNRQRFRNGFFFVKPERKSEKAKRIVEGERLTIFEWADTSDRQASLANFQRRKAEFLGILREVQEYNSKLSQEITEQQFATTLSDFKLQCQSPWLTNKGNALRSELFLSGLELHQAWLQAVLQHPYFRQAFWAISKMIGGWQPKESYVTEALWQLFFLAVPVVSTTLASVERLFQGVSANFFGYLLLDEAGQAVPQAGIGALWRAKKALVVGDPLQIEPIFSLPEYIVHLAGKEICKTPEEIMEMSPGNCSLQTLADKAAPLGGYLVDDWSGSRWIGTPLRVHRRCEEPMFSLANELAYDKKMFSAVPESELKLSSSCWYHVPGRAKNKHWVKEQGEFIQEQVRALIHLELKLPSVFIITPFKEVRINLRKLLSAKFFEDIFSELPPGTVIPDELEIRRWRNERIGTVHTFQGKEEEAVYFVLGADAQAKGAVDWASSKPNLLNVALTRAKKRFYIVGDKDLWITAGVFRILEQRLPVVCP